MKNIVRFFDRLEDVVRAHLSRYPIIYAIFGGVGVVLFWRGVWETADVLAKLHPVFDWFFYPPVQIVVSALGLMLIGLMVSAFIGHRILLSGLKHEKKLEEETEKLVEAEAVTLTHLRDEIRALKREVEELRRK